ncbi:MAG: YihY/virulence factor BrkB family protein [Dehalococcoidia bacterium]|nr:YihY/virulence factor BrkB family protein [Dehalococcoidia bacterium]
MKQLTALKAKLNSNEYVKILKDTIQGIGDDKVTRLSASLAYATLFSIIPFLSFLIMVGGFFHIDLAGQLYVYLQSILGPEVVDQLRDILANAGRNEGTGLSAIIALGITLFGATTIFAEIQGSLNTIWGIKAIPKKGWLKYIRNRLLSFSIVLVFAFILLITFTITNVVENLGVRFTANYPDVAESLVKVTGMAINLGVTVFIFTLIFKVLPDAKIKMKDVIVGALVTSVLFLIGQWGISLYIGMANIGSAYGVAAFMIILITWIYYSAMIIYIGAEFTEAWANEKGDKIVPDEFAVATRIIEIHDENAPVQTINKVKIDSDDPRLKQGDIFAAPAGD